MQILFLTTQAFRHVPQTQHISLPSRKTVMSHDDYLIFETIASNSVKSHMNPSFFWRTREQRVSKKPWSFQSWTSKFISVFIWLSAVSVSVSLSLSLFVYIYFAVWCILILQGFCAFHRLRKNSWLCTSRSSKLLAGRTCPCPICFVILCYPDTSSEIMYLHSHISTHQKLF